MVGKSIFRPAWIVGAAVLAFAIAVCALAAAPHAYASDDEVTIKINIWPSKAGKVDYGAGTFEKEAVTHEISVSPAPGYEFA